MTEKIIGYILLAAGIALIGYGIFASYSIFTGASDAPQIFKAEQVQTKKVQQSAKDFGLSQEALQNQLQSAISQQLQAVLPPNSIPTMMNLGSWSVFAGILFFGGGQIAGIGIKMIKKS
ncbi:MAG: hypothetical protein HYV78_01645 [Candidatus Wildermuthbacteria bacterium]|nr:hypothetical protein [Candidatus Wildermuthbacteria bacterium]